MMTDGSSASYPIPSRSDSTPIAHQRVSIEQRLSAEMTRIFHRAVIPGIAFHVLLGCLTMLAAWNVVPKLVIFGFSGALFAVCLFRAGCHFAFAQRSPPPDQLLGWRRYFVSGTIMAAIEEAVPAEVLVPELRPGDVVVMDNLSSHKRARTRELIEATGAAVLFLPPYSPDLNPIEMIFAKAKHLLRSLACRTREELWNVMQSVLDQITPSDAANCFRHCGYTLQMH